METIIGPVVIIALVFLGISFNDVIANLFKGAVTAAGKKQKYRFVSQTLFTPAERSFLGVIDNAIDGQYRVMGKVRLADLITTESSATTEDSQENLICPRCSSQLVKRIAKKGDKKGTEFYGCAAYPKCRYMKEIC